MVEVVVVLDQLLREENLLLSKVLAAASSSEEQGVEGGGEGEQVLSGQAGCLLLPLPDAQHLVLADNINVNDLNGMIVTLVLTTLSTDCP